MRTILTVLFYTVTNVFEYYMYFFRGFDDENY